VFLLFLSLLPMPMNHSLLKPSGEPRQRRGGAASSYPSWWYVCKSHSTIQNINQAITSLKPSFLHSSITASDLPGGRNSKSISPRGTPLSELGVGRPHNWRCGGYVTERRITWWRRRACARNRRRFRQVKDLLTRQGGGGGAAARRRRGNRR
jgi:hypothetical protein